MPTVNGRYDVQRRLAVGGMGEVFLAIQQGLPGTERPVILKMMLPDLAQQPELVTQFLDEARVISSLNHPNVVSLFEVGMWEHTPFIAMEWVKGRTVAQLRLRLKELGLGLDPWATATLIRDAALGLAHAHRAVDASGQPLGIVHRDVSPQNLMVRDDGVTKVLDFGIARSAAQASRTATGTVKGKLAYMAPEQLLGQPVNHLADQFALGVVFWELLTGARLFQGDSDSVLVQKVLREAVAAPSSLAGVPPPLEQVVLRMLSRSPDQRFPGCAEVAQELDRTLAGQPTAGAPALAELMARIDSGDSGPPSMATPASAFPELLLPGSAGAGASGVPVDGIASTRTTHRQEPPRTLYLPPPPRRRWGVFATIAAVALGLIVLGGWEATSLPAQGRRVVVLVAAPQQGQLLAGAARSLVSAQLAERDDRFWMAETPAVANVVVVVSCAQADDGVVLDAALGRTPALARSRVSVRAPSVAQAAAQAGASIAGALAEGQPARPREPREAEALQRIGATSLASYRAFRAVENGYWSSEAASAGVFRSALDSLIAQDPGWAHPYALRGILQSSKSPEKQESLAAAARQITPGRDPSGEALLQALAQASRDDHPAALKTLQAVYSANGDDLEAGLLLYVELYESGRSNDAIAVIRELHQRRPDLQFGADLVMALGQAGRGAEAPGVAQAWLARAPESEGAMTLQVALDAQQGREAAALQRAREIMLIFGEAPHRLDLLCDVLLEAGQAGEASRIADGLVREEGIERPRGLYRLGVASILQGRFGAAADSLAQAESEGQPFGDEFELTQTLEALRSLDTLSGDRAAELHHTRELAAAARNLGTLGAAAAADFQAALLSRKGGEPCPSWASAVAGVPEGPMRSSARLLGLRAAAEAGCGTCSEAVAAGLAPAENSTESLLAFGRCAEQEGALSLARDVLQRASMLAMITSGQMQFSSPYHSILARYELARVAEQLHDLEGARRGYTEFLSFWDHADRPIPEVEAARAALRRLGAPATH